MKLSKKNEIMGALLEKYNLKEELDSLSKFIIKMEGNLVYYLGGEVVSKIEWKKRAKRIIEILKFVEKESEKFSIVDGDKMKLL